MDNQIRTEDDVEFFRVDLVVVVVAAVAQNHMDERIGPVGRFAFGTFVDANSFVSFDFAPYSAAFLGFEVFAAARYDADALAPPNFAVLLFPVVKVFAPPGRQRLPRPGC